MPLYAYLLIVGGTLSWTVPFVLQGRRHDAPQQVDRRARWGLLLLALAYTLLWQANFWTRRPESWRVAISMMLFVAATCISSVSVRALGRHWRIDAAVDPDHALVRHGIYDLVRHPIYLSMLCVLLATGLLVAPLSLLALAVIVFLVGTGIRVRVEDRLLASRFGAEFDSYRQTVPALLPWPRPFARHGHESEQTSGHRDRVPVQRDKLTSPTARRLIDGLDAELASFYPEPGATHFRLDPEEVAEGSGVFLVASVAGNPVGCGALRRIAARTGEIKRMYVIPDERGHGVGHAVLAALEAEARRLGIARLVLETGIRQPAALALYRRAGFSNTSPFGEYVESPLSVCLTKEL
jgi:putative acetyltransferase